MKSITLLMITKKKNQKHLQVRVSTTESCKSMKSDKIERKIQTSS